MSHILVIYDDQGKELARVPVKAGYSTREVPVPKEVIERMEKLEITNIGVGSKGGGKEKVG